MAIAAARKSAPAKAKTAQPPVRASAPAAPTKRVPSLTAVPATAGPVIKLNNLEASQDPRFKKVMDKLEKSANKARTHPAAAKKAAEAQAAANPPTNEKMAGAKVNQVETMKAAETGKPDSGSFLTLLRSEIQKVMPKDLGGTEKFMKGEDKQQLNTAMAGNVNKQKDEASGGIKAASNQSPDTGKIPEIAVTPLPSEPALSQPPAIGGAEAMPAKKSESEISLQQSKQDVNQSLAEAEVSPQQLHKANDPRFSAVLASKAAVEKQADIAPQQYRAAEQKAISQSAAKAGADEQKGLAGFQKAKGVSAGSVKARQLDAKAKEEAERKKVADTIEGIYKKTREEVDKKLASLETDVSARFDKGIETALKKMTDYIDDRMFKWKLARYGSSLGLLWLKDKLLGLPDEVNVFYEAGRKLFAQELDRVITDIARLVETRLQEAKDAIAKGQKEISVYVQGLPKNLQAVGKAAEKEMTGRFDELRQGVDDKKNDLAQNLAQRYKEAHDKAGEKLKEMQSENKGLLTSLKEKLGEVLKVLRDFKERIMGMLKKGKAAIDLIVADPIGFLKNLLAALQQGFNQFVDNIWTHLKKGFMSWLFGSLAKAGIEIPSDLTLPSILKLVLGVLGITYEKMRAKAVKILGPTSVTVIEKVAGYVGALIKGGPAALWEMVKEDLGDLKKMVIDAIQDWLITTLIKKAVTKIVSMFNPVGAIVQAIIMIYDVVMFVVNKAAQLLDFVEAVVSSIAEIASGAVGRAANWIENSLGKLVPVLIGLLASLIGLDGISEKIREFILKVQDRVDKAIDKVIGKVVETVKKMFGAVKAGAGKVLEWWKQKKPFKTAGGANHDIYFTGDEKKPIPMVASKDPKPIEHKLNEFLGMAKKSDASEKMKNGTGLITEVHNMLKKDPSNNDIVVKIKNLFDIYEPQKTPKKFDKKKFATKFLSKFKDTVATHMIVDWLDADNIKGGTKPQKSALANVRNQLVTDPGEDSPDKYVKGHLLNENLGGKGDPDNLFPITGKANSLHLHSTETIVKEWVIDKKQWAWYEVKVDDIKETLAVPGKQSPSNSLNCTFYCKVVLKDESGNEKKSFVSAVPSVHKAKPADQEAKVFDIV